MGTALVLVFLKLGPPASGAVAVGRLVAVTVGVLCMAFLCGAGFIWASIGVKKGSKRAAIVGRIMAIVLSTLVIFILLDRRDQWDSARSGRGGVIQVVAGFSVYGLGAVGECGGGVAAHQGVAGRAGGTGLSAGEMAGGWRAVEAVGDGGPEAFGCIGHQDENG